MKLGSKASLLIVAMVVALFVPLSSVMIHFQEQALRKVAFDAVDSVARSSSLMLLAFRGNAQRNASSLAASVPVESIRAKRFDALAAHLEKMLATQNFGNGIFLLDSRGDFLVDYPPHPELRGRSFSYREYFSRTLAEMRGVMSDPYVSERTGRPVLTFTAPIFDDQQTLLAVMGCSYDLLAPDVLGGLRDQRLGRTGYVYLFDRTRLMILHPDSKRLLQRDIPAGANRLLDKAIEGFEGTGATVNSRGVPMLVSFRRVPGTPWILGAQIPQSEAFEATAASRRLMVATTLISLLLILGVGVATVRHFTRPLRHLHQAARAITLELEAGAIGSGVFPLLDSIRSRDELGTLARTFRELVERQHQSLDLLKRAASEWERTFDAVNEAVLCLDRNGTVLRINRMAADWFRIHPDAAVGQVGKDLVLGTEATAAFWPEATGLDAEHARTWTGPLPQREGIFEFRASPVVQDAEISGMILAIRDFTEQARKEEDIRKQAFFDALTGLPNRTLLVDRLQQALASGTRARTGVGVLFLDLDHFKEVNDTLGHDAGDALLKAVAARLEALTRRNDTVARLGGDEFVIVISEIGRQEDAQMVAAKIILAFADAFDIQGKTLRVGTSIGISIAPADGTDWTTLLKNADAAMYQAKREGRSSFCLFSEAH